MDGLNTMTIQSVLLELIFIFKKAYHKHTAESNLWLLSAAILRER